MINQKFGELTVINKVGQYGDKWLCQCSCGNFTVVLGTILRTGLAKSCEKLEKLSTRSGNKKVMHAWIKRNKPRPELCEQCNNRPVTVLSHKEAKAPRVYRRNFNDYEWLCKRCFAIKKWEEKPEIVNDKDVYEIRKLYALKTFNQRKLALIFEVNMRTISCIVNYKDIYSREEEVPSAPRR